MSVSLQEHNTSVKGTAHVQCKRHQQDMQWQYFTENTCLIPRNNDDTSNVNVKCSKYYCSVKYCCLKMSFFSAQEKPKHIHALGLVASFYETHM